MKLVLMLGFIGNKPGAGAGPDEKAYYTAGGGGGEESIGQALYFGGGDAWSW